MSRKYKSLVKKLQLDDGFVAVLKKPHLENLNQLVTKFNRGKKLKKQISLNAPLSAKKYGEVAVAKALVTAKTDKTTKDFATLLQQQQLEGWLASQKSADDIFALLKLKEDGYLFAKSRKLETLSEYIKFYSANKSPQEETNIFRVVKNGFGGDGDFT
ncbi:hypothetical protein PC119_g3248 [Phytophthora cactorum]|nr:hypothetical protein PC114_g14183 [Phytophthora cactorum]KAG3037919.1 hypothetical protein PC119_g3248 [Phytophthora cactorum]KAG3177184.1 hypothetical protein PC128_g16963 [Phytophthora cactorum]